MSICDGCGGTFLPIGETKIYGVIGDTGSCAVRLCESCYQRSFRRERK